MAGKPEEQSLIANNKKSVDEAIDPHYIIDMESLTKLKDSTKKILVMIEEIQRKTITKNAVKHAFAGDTNTLLPMNLSFNIDLAADMPESIPLKQLEQQIQLIEEIEVENDDCSVTKKLMRKCHCLNRPEFNDLIIHFNEDTKFSTSRLGEMIKNMNILKRFMYIGGEYSKNALMFMNEGLTKSPLIEKVDILIACSHADLCNVFNGDSVVHVCLAWPVKYKTSGDQITQNLTARLLYRMAVVEEGKRYLNFNSKTIVALQKLVKTQNKHLDDDTIRFIQATIKLLSPAILISTSNNATCYHKADEDAANNIINTLSNFRKHLTVEEVKYHLDLLNKLSQTNYGKIQLWREIGTVYTLIKELLLQYDDSSINMLLINIMSRLLKKPLNKDELSSSFHKAYIVTDMATEPPEVKNESIQIPIRPKNYKNIVNIMKSQSQAYRSAGKDDKDKKKGNMFNKSATFTRKSRNFSNRTLQKGKSVSTAAGMRLSRTDQTTIIVPIDQSKQPKVIRK